MDRSGEEYETNAFVGASYELADGLTFSIGAASLDSDSASNTSGDSVFLNLFSEAAGGLSGQGFNLNDPIFLGKERRDWVASASITVEF